MKCFRLLTGSRIASWLPSFSVEVMHTTNILGIAQANNSQLTAMVSSSVPSVDIDLGRDAKTGSSLIQDYCHHLPESALQHYPFVYVYLNFC